MDKKRDQTPGQEETHRVNPFERNNLDNLQHPFWSPSIFHNVHMGETPPQKGWTIDQLAVLFPKPIEHSPSSHMNEYPLDSEAKAKAQADIDKFFNNGLIAPSPAEQQVLTKKGLLCQTPCDPASLPTSNDASTMTDISLLNLPSELETLLADFMKSKISSGSVPAGVEPAEEINQNVSRTVDNGKNSIPRRRLDLSFGEIMSEEDSQETFFDSDVPYGDLFGLNREVVSPLTYTSCGTSSLRLSTTAHNDVSMKYRRCEFTPETTRDVTMDSPQFTPIQDDGEFGSEVGTSSKQLKRHSSLTTQDNWSYSSTPKVQRPSSSLRTGFRRFKLSTEVSIEEKDDSQTISNTTVETEMSTDVRMGQAQTQALDVQLVLETVFEHVDLNTLKDCRLVCKLWREASFPSFKKKSICKLLNPLIRDSPCQLTNSASIYDDFTSGFPYENIEIAECTQSYSKANEGIQELAISNIFLNWGQFLRGIRFKLQKHPSCSSSNSLANILTEWCPNLTELEIIHGENIEHQKLNLDNCPLPNIKRILFHDNHNIEDPVARNSVKILSQIDELFKATINVEVVDVTSQFQNLSYSIAHAVVTHGKNLQSLSWNNNLLERDLEVLAKTPGDMKIKKLRFNCSLMPYQSTVQNMYDFLSKISRTLEILYLKGDILESYDTEDDEGLVIAAAAESITLHFLELEFPQMHKLKVLIIKDIFHCRFNTLDFVLSLPNLEQLVLHNVSYASVVYPYKPDELFHRLLNPSMELLRNPHKKLWKLDLHGEIMDCRFVDLLSKCFPNLKMTNLFVNSGFLFIAVLQKLKTLEELKLRFITISFEEINGGLVTFLPEMLELKKLTLTNAGPHHFMLSKHVVDESFKVMNKLERLELVKCSILNHEYKDVLETLNCCGRVIFKDCFVQTLMPLNSSFLNGSEVPSS